MARDSFQNSSSGPIASPTLALAIVLSIAAFSMGYFAGHRGVGGALPAGSFSGNGVSVHFSPKGGCTDTVVSELDAASRSVKVMAYSFTSREISAALIRAQQRGAKVTMIVDEKELAQSTRADECAHAGITVLVDGQHPIAHNKIMLIDGRTIITGSFNFTEQAEHGNAENLLVLHDLPQLYQQYDENFQRHLGHSQPFSESFLKSDHRSKSRPERQ